MDVSDYVRVLGGGRRVGRWEFNKDHGGLMRWVLGMEMCRQTLMMISHPLYDTARSSSS